MNNILATGGTRRISSANINHYDKSVHHPDRIMKEHDIFYVTEGSWGIGQNGRSYLLEKDDLIILHAGCHHYGVEECAPGTRTLFLHMECRPEDAFLAGDSPDTKAAVPDKCLKLPVVIRCRDSMRPYSIFRDIVSTFWSDMPARQIKLASLLDLLLAELAGISVQTVSAVNPLVRETLERIRLSGNKIYTISELSGYLHVCSRVLTRRFKQATGKTIHRYQMDMKLEMAYASIKSGEIGTLKDIAGNFGFYDEFHFSRLFKQKYGFPPSRLNTKKT